MAIRYFKSGGTAWNSATSWATTIGGSDNAPAVPTALDDVYFDASSASSCPITTTSGACKTLTCTGYTGTITTNAQLSISGNVTLGASSVHNGASAIFIPNSTATITSNGNSNINCPVIIQGAGSVITLADNWTINGLFTTQPGSGTITLNGNNIFCRGGIFINSGGVGASLTRGTTNISITNTGSIFTSSNSTGGLANNFTINAPGSTITLVQSNVFYRTGTFTYVAGTISGTWNFNVTASCTLDMTNGGTHTLITPFSLLLQTASTVTMLSDWYLSGINIGFTTTINGFSLYSSGTVAINVALTGTTILRLKSSGSGQSFTGTGTIAIVGISFEAGANTITIGNLTIVPRSGGSTITYTSGSVNHTGTITIVGPNGLTMNTSGMSFRNITIQTTGLTITINSTLTVTGILSITNNIVIIFAGSAGFTIGTLSRIDSPTTGTGINLTPGNTYTITGGLIWYHPTLGTYSTIKSGTTGVSATLTVQRGATFSIGNVSAIDIDSSGGQPIYVWRPGPLTNSINWRTLTSVSMQKHSAFVN